MKYIRLLVFAMLIVAWFALVALEADKMQDDIEQMQADIETIKQVSPLNEDSIEVLRTTSRELVSRGFELERLRKWIISPSDNEFSESCAIFKSLGYEDSKDLLFQRYIESQVLEQYVVYASTEGVRKYRHSYLEQQMTSTNNDWWDKWLYNSVDGTDTPIPDVVIPSNLLASKQRLNSFLSTMGGVFIEK